MTCRENVPGHSRWHCLCFSSVVSFSLEEHVGDTTDILVCKRDGAQAVASDESTWAQSIQVAESLQKHGYVLSLNDQFVIAAGHAMAAIVSAGLSFSEPGEDPRFLQYVLTVSSTATNAPYALCNSF